MAVATALDSEERPRSFEAVAAKQEIDARTQLSNFPLPLLLRRRVIMIN